MKSPLVDVLRQANSDAPAEDADQKLPNTGVQQKPGASERHAAQSLELDLLETGRYEAPGEPDDDVASDTNIVIGDDATAPNQENATPGVHAAMELPAPERGVRSIRSNIIVRIGRFSPVICVIALATSVGAYLVLNDLSVMDLNDNFSVYSASTESPNYLQGGDANELQLPTTGVSVFEQIDKGAVSKPAIPEQTFQPTPNEKSVVPGASLVPADAARDSVPTSTRNEKTLVKDAAYASVVTAYEAYRRDDLDEAETQYFAALKIEPNHRDALAGIAAVYLQTGRPGLALAAYEKLLAIEPQNTAAAAAILAIRSDDPEWEIESEIKLLLQRFPDSHHLHNALGSYYVALEKWPDAKHAFLIAHRLAPGIADYSYNTAVSLDRMGQSSAAQAYYEIALNSANEHSAFDRSALLAHLEQFEQLQRERL
ncbi:MAG: tetratricopeptide repeat protein [Woeseiaceae bacterium]